MKTLNSPWRQQYVEKTHKPKTGCVFCQKIAENNDAENLILGRYKHHFVVMNKYPYNGGHLLVIPFEHVGSLGQLSPASSAEMMELLKAATTIIQTTLGNTGTNIGINMGKDAGAGIPDHLHAHVLPRWEGDTNFLAVFADTKQVAVDMQKMYQELKPKFEKLTLSKE